MNKKINKTIKSIIVVLALSIIIGLYYNFQYKDTNNNKIYYEISSIPEYNGKIYIEINNNIPEFSDVDFNIKEDYYSEFQNNKVRYGDDKN